MKVNWKTAENQSPIFFSRRAEQTPPIHQINLTLDGSIFTKRRTAGGKRRARRVSRKMICLNPAGQSFKAEN